MKNWFNIILPLLLHFPILGFSQTSNWTLTGPSNFPTNISGQINGIGRVCQIKFDPINANTIYACSASGGLWKSINSGNQWVNMGTDKLPTMGTSSVCIDHSNPQIIYLSSGDPNYYNDDFGIWKTIDGGINWTQSNTGIGNRMAVELLMDPLDHLVVIAATSDGIWKTTDGGSSWSIKLAGNSFTDMSWQPSPASNIIYASSMNKFFRSSDRGDTWVEINSGLSGMLSNGTRLAVSQQNPSVVYLATIRDEGTIFKSVDSGLSFTIQYHDITRSLTGYDTTGGGQGNYNFCLEANPDDANQLFLASHNIWRSNDAGITWIKLTNWWQTVHTDMHDYAFQPGNSTHLFNANDGGVWLTNNSGIDWIQKSDGLAATENYHAAVSPLYAGMISAGTQDNGELIFSQNAWKTNRGGDWTTRMMMDYSFQKFVYYFDDKERRPLPSGSGDEYGAPVSVTSAALKHVFSPDNQQLAYLSGTSVWQSKNVLDALPVWTQITSTSATIKSMALSKGHPNIMAYSVGGKFYITHNALDAVPSFTNSTLPLATNASDIAISSVDTNLIFIILGTKVYQSIDGGNSFSDYSGTLVTLNHLNIFLDNYSGNKGLYVGNSAGVFYRNSTMSDWVNYSGVLPSIASIKDILYFNDGGIDARLYVSYYGRGTWETSLEQSNSCVAPQISNTTFIGNNLQVNWNATGASAYDIQYRELGTINWLSISATINSTTISNYSGCTEYEIRVRSRCGTDSSLWSQRAFFNTPTNLLNNDFDNHSDIGMVGAAGSVCYDALNQRYTLYASGEDIWDKQDEFHYLYKKVEGDISISARVKQIGNIYGWAKGGVMIRESLDTDSKQAMCVLTPGNGYAMQWRENTNDYSDNKDTAGKAPGWVKLEKIGNLFTAYFSTNGTTWNVLHSANISMNDTVYIGLANCSHIDSTLNEAIFDHIVINGQALQHSIVEKSGTPFYIYPNPSKNQINIEFDTFMNQALTVNVLDIHGHKLMSSYKSKEQTNCLLDIQHLAAGNYLIEVVGKLRSICKFIKE